MIVRPASICCRMIVLIMLVSSVGLSRADDRIGIAQYPIEVIPNVSHLGSAFALSADGAKLISGGYDGTVKLWDVRTGRLLRTFVGHKNEVLVVRFIGDQTQLVSAAKDMTIRIWRVADGKLLRTTELNIPDQYRWDIDLSPDGTRVITAQSAAGKGNFKLWDAASGRLLQTFDEHCESVTFSADGLQAVSGSGEGTIVKRWDLQNGRLINAYAIKSQFSAVTAVAISRDGVTIASASRYGPLSIWRADAERPVFQLPYTEPVALSPDGKQVISTGSHGEITLWDIESGKALRSFDAAAKIRRVSFSPDGRRIIASAGQQIRLWDASSGERLQTFGGEQDAFTHESISNDGKWLLVGSSDKTALLWDAGTGQLIQSFVGHNSPVMRVAISPDSKLIATAGAASRLNFGKPSDNVIRLWDVATGKTIQTLVGHSDQIGSLGFSPDGKHLLSSGQLNDNSIRLWDIRTGQELRNFGGHAGAIKGVTSAVFSPDGRLIASGGTDGAAKLWDVVTGKLLRTFVHQESSIVFSVVFSPDGKKLVSADSDGTAKLWDVATGKMLRVFDGHGGLLTSTALSADGAYLLTSSTDHTTRLWKTRSGDLIRSFPDANSALFYPDGTRVLLNSNYSIRTVEIGSGLPLATYLSARGEWLTITHEGFFAGSDGGTSLISVVRGVEGFSVNQLYQSLFRPDLVREKIVGDPRGLVRAAAAQLDLDKVLASGNAPDVRVTLPIRGLSATTVDDRDTTAEAEITDRGGGVGRVEWRLNGVTIGINDLAARSPGILRLSRSLQLDPGRNSVEVVAYNRQNLVASVPAVAIVTFQPSPPVVSGPQSPSGNPKEQPGVVAKPRLFVLAAGVNDYDDKRIKLAYAVSDAREVARAFKESSGDLYQTIEVNLMIDSSVNRDKLDAAFAELAGKLRTSDLFVLYFAGHGKTVDGRYYFIPQNFVVEGGLTDKAVDAAVKTKGIAQDQWQRWFASIPARRGVILFDTCDSGTLVGDAGETQQLERVAASARLAEATGRSILTASGSTEEALEGYHGHGLFTYEVLDAFNQADGNHNGTIELNELAAYVYAEVTELSKRIFKKSQVPQMKITANYPLANQTRILQDETAPVAAGKPTYQVSQATQLQVQPNAGAPVVRSLSAKSTVTVLESRNGWSLVSSDGKPIGYVATRDLAPMQ